MKISIIKIIIQIQDKHIDQKYSNNKIVIVNKYQYRNNNIHNLYQEKQYVVIIYKLKIKINIQ